MDKELEKYADMLDMPHYQSPNRPHMSLHDRAAQFSSFAALTGHSEAIEETARLTDVWHDQDENIRQQMDETLQHLIAIQSERPSVRIVYFQPDKYKAGGAYLELVGRVRRIDTERGLIIMADRSSVSISNILSITKDL